MKLKEKSKIKKNKSPDPAIVGRVRTRDPDPGQILIPGPATDPRLRIHGPGACLKSTDDWTFGLFYGLLTDSF